MSVVLTLAEINLLWSTKTAQQDYVYVCDDGFLYKGQKDGTLQRVINTNYDDWVKQRNSNQTLPFRNKTIIQGTRLSDGDIVDIKVNDDGKQLIEVSSSALPTGAATEVKQDAGNLSLSNLDTNLGAKADASASSDTGTFSLISLFKRLLEKVTTLTTQVPKNYFFEISKGNISGSMTITKFGLNTDVDAGTTPEDVWDLGGTFVSPTVARRHNVVSTSINDTSAGTGAKTIFIRGINEAYAAVSETITMNGTSNVATTNTYFHIHLMQVLTGGSVGNNVGIITATAQTDGTVTCQISATLNQSCSSIYMVPVNYKGCLIKARARMANATANSEVTVGLYNKPFGGVFQLKTQIGLNNAGSSSVVLDYTASAPFILQAKSLTKLTCTSASNNNTNIQGEYDLILVAD